MKKEELIFSHCSENNKFVYFHFKNNEAMVSLDKNTFDIGCSCHNGVLFGVNNKQQCYHKKFILNKFEKLYKKENIEK